MRMPRTLPPSSWSPSTISSTRERNPFLPLSTSSRESESSMALCACLSLESTHVRCRLRISSSIPSGADLGSTTVSSPALTSSLERLTLRRTTL
ncbi:hypothetical protein [Conexivisphaera calida]|uniref:hypothetical protein n=1 Tax=Conexivisphaera calida TaxID=1874277 RepID=UPI001E425978|nr:hypothetical protein [Conexivisphaera calida]